MIENSPRPSNVSPTFNEVAPDRPAVLPASCPATTTATSDRSAAPIASQTAPPKLNGSTDRPKLKKNTAPNKSRNGTTSFSNRSLCSVSPRVSPKSSAPIASATCISSPAPANSNKHANTTIRKTSFDGIRNSQLRNGVAHRPRIMKPTMKPSASPADESTPKNELAPLKMMPESKDK